MKKIVIGLLFSFLGLFAFAEKSTGYIGGHFSVPIIFESAEESGIKTESRMTSIGFGLDEVGLTSERLGIYLNLELILPMKINLKIKSGSDTYNFEVERSDYNSLFGFNAFVGPTFCLYNEGSFLFAVSPGASFVMLFSETASTDTTSILFGIGANVQGGININEKSCISIGADFAYDFLGFSKVNNGDFSSSKGRNFIITPKIGIGYKPNK